MKEHVERMLAPVRNRIVNMVARAVIKSINDGTKIQTAQFEGFKNEIHDDAERFQNYGFTSVPLPGAEAVVIFPGGLRDHPLIIAIDDRKARKKDLEPGESAMYHYLGHYFMMKAEGIDADVPSIKMKSGTTIEFEGISTKINTQKLAIKNALGDGVVELMLEFIDAVMVGTVSTSIGEQLLKNPQFAAIKARLMAFKE